MLKTIIDRCSQMNIHEKREASNEYFELVFLNEDAEKWEEMLVDVLGPAVKPPKTRPTKEDVTLTRKYGGIYDNQTLFKKELEEGIAIAMLWPWQDNTHTTLKAAFIKKEG